MISNATEARTGGCLRGDPRVGIGRDNPTGRLRKGAIRPRTDRVVEKLQMPRAAVKKCPARHNHKFSRSLERPCQSLNKLFKLQSVSWQGASEEKAPA